MCFSLDNGARMGEIDGFAFPNESLDEPREVEMKLYEYQAMELFARSGIPTPFSRVASSPEEARQLTAEVGKKVVIKAQVHMGGRGKAGGVKLAETPDEAEKAAEAILGMQIKGLTVHKVLVAEAIDIKNEIYLSVTIDRVSKRPIVMASAAGGVEIEQIAAETPEKIIKYIVDPIAGLRSFEARKVTAQLFENQKAVGKAANLLVNLYHLFINGDCSLVEINPLVLDADGNVIAADGKVDIDDNALYRQPELLKYREAIDEDPNEVRARELGLNYVSLDGDIGCIVNGAGLAMATVDWIQLFGGSPANFLDLGGSSSVAKMVRALDIILGNPKVKTVLVNILAGITRCDDIANGILEARKQIQSDKPIVLRLAGTNEEAAQALLEGTDIQITPSMREGVQTAVEIAKSK